MTMPKLKRPSLGTVLGFTALVIAIGGTAHAATSYSTKTVIVRKGEIAKGAVTAKALAPGAVHAIAIADGAVHRKALAENAVGPRRPRQGIGARESAGRGLGRVGPAGARFSDRRSDRPGLRLRRSSGARDGSCGAYGGSGCGR